MMKYLIVAFSLTFVAAITPSGGRPSQPEFWVMLALYGLPLILLAWPLYVRLLRQSRIPPPLKPVLGAGLFPIPAALLQVGHWMVYGDLIVNPIRFVGGFYFVFLVWYMLFGFALGALLGFEQWSTRRLRA